MGLDKFIISGLLVGLFAYALFSFAYFISVDNGKTELIENDVLNGTFQKINESLLNIQAQSEAEYNATSNEPISSGFGSLIYYSIKGAGNVFGGMVTAVFNPILNLSTKTLGIPPVVIGVIISIILVSLIFLAWKMYRLGA